MRKITLWTKEKEAELIKLYNDFSLTFIEIAQRMNTTCNAISMHSYKLKLTGRKNAAIHSKKTHFQKGLIPWNKHKKGWYATGTEKTRFKKGHLPKNLKAGNIISFRKTHTSSGYELFIRVKPGKWKRLCVYNWEQENGPVPTGFVIRLIDQNPNNTGLKNLMCISRQENGLLNKKLKKTKNNQEKFINPDEYLLKTEQVKMRPIIHDYPNLPKHHESI